MARRHFGVGLLFGAITGLAAGILAAPKSGQETRKDLKRRADELKSEASHRTDQVKDKTGQVVTEVKQRADDITRAVQGDLHSSDTKDKNVHTHSKRS